MGISHRRVDLSGRDALFPSEPDIRVVPKAIKRSAAGDVIRLLSKDERLVLVHGVGGCGKTTLMQQIVNELPTGSVSITFDCFGGGRYIYADDKRHLPENAFLQLTNEVALALRLPLFVPRNFKQPANVRSFLTKLKTAGHALEQIEPKLLPLTGLDATGELNILLAGVASTRIAVLKASREEADIPQNTLGPLGAIGGNSYEFDHDHDSTQWRTIARLALPISRDNSEALFNDAIGIAKEIDQEAVDQIEFMSVGAEHANIADPAERRRIAANTYSSGAKCVCPAQ